MISCRETEDRQWFRCAFCPELVARDLWVELNYKHEQLYHYCKCGAVCLVPRERKIDKEQWDKVREKLRGFTGLVWGVRVAEAEAEIAAGYSFKTSYTGEFSNNYQISLADLQPRSVKDHRVVWGDRPRS